MTRTPPQPPLSVVTPETTGIAPPRQLGQYGMQFWQRVQAEYAIRDAGGIEILMQGCGAIDRAESLAEIVAREGEVIRTRTGTIKSHPAVRDELTARALVLKAIQRLGIDVEPIKSPGRPTKPIGWIPPGNQ
jgi:hypothetical protein